MLHPLFVSAPKHIDDLLVDELNALGAKEIKRTTAGASFNGSLELAYKICLNSRVASRVLLEVGRFPAPDERSLLQGTQALAWEEHLDPHKTIAVETTARRARIENTQHASLVLKDGVVDRLRDTRGERPSVDTKSPDVRLRLHLDGEHATASIDLCGDALHRRGYRQGAGEAPLKENLAAALLIRAGWPALAAEGAALVDPMCGSGTLVIEAALIAADIAPGLLRERFGFESWAGHDVKLWDALVAEAHTRREKGLANLADGRFEGSDVDKRSLAEARANAQAAGLGRWLRFSPRDVGSAERIHERGLLITNAPFGERLSRQRDLIPVYRSLGERLKSTFVGWQAAVFTSDLELGNALGLEAARRNKFQNGPIESHLLRFDMTAPRVRDPGPGAQKRAESLLNRLQKNHARLGKRAKRENVTCYRVYDADIPEYALAIDLYEGRAHVQEYAPPKTVDSKRAERRLKDALAVIPDALGIMPEAMFFKVRRKQKGTQQYERLSQEKARFEVSEGGYRFWVNLSDYLDTGLFLDHRLTRKKIAEMAAGKHFLNLFAYTGSATVYAAGAGAASTTTVDMSNTYSRWTEENLRLNRQWEPKNRVIRANVLHYLRDERDRYDLIFLDPPTFSNSKGMEDSFDVQRDHPDLLQATAKLLKPGGQIVFSNNFKRFSLELPEGLNATEITAATIPFDFERKARVHRCWTISKEG